jgi:putative Ca2+/H+ antiporter (TMEM165/GDT1 family)
LSVRISSLVLNGLQSNSFLVSTLASLTFNKWAVNISSTLSLMIIGLYAMFYDLQLLRVIPPIIMDIIVSILYLFMGSKIVNEAMDIPMHLTYEMMKLRRQNIPNGMCSDDKQSCEESSEPVLRIKDMELENESLEKSALLFIESQDSTVADTCSETERLYLKQYEEELAEKYFLSHSSEASEAKFLYEFSIIFMIVLLGELGGKSQVSNMIPNGITMSLLCISISISNLILTACSVAISMIVCSTFTKQNLYLFSGSVFILYGMLSFLINTQIDLLDGSTK